MGKFSKIKKYSKPSLTVNEKIQELNKELEKTGVLFEAPANSTSGLYGGQDEEDTTQNTNTRIEDPDGGSNTSGVPYEGTYGNYDPSGTVSYFSFSGNGNYNIGATIRGFDEVTDGDGNGLGYYKIRITPSYGVSYLHLDRIWTERTGALNAYWKVVGRRVGGQEIDLLLGTQFWDKRPTSISFWSNNVAQPIPGEIRQKPSWYHFMTRGDRDKDSWGKVKGMLDAGKEWMDRMFGEFGENMRKKAKKIAELFKKQSEETFGDFIEGLDGFKERLEGYIEKISPIVPAGAAFDKFLDHQENPKHTKDNPYDVPFTEKQKENIGKRLEKALDQSAEENSPNYPRPKGVEGFAPSDIKSKIERGEKLEQPDIEWLNKQLNVQDDKAYHLTFNNLSGESKITKNSDGSYTIEDNYVYSDPGDTSPVELIAGPLVGMHVKPEGGDSTYYDKDPSKYPDAKKIGTLKKMYIKGKFPASGTTKEEITFEDIERQLILEELEYDQLIEKLEKQSCFTKQEQTYKTIKRVSSATKDPSPILETKIIQTEQKSPSRFLAKEKREDTSRARWLKKA